MLTDRKPRKLAHEILGLIAIAAGCSLILFLLLRFFASGLIEEYIFNHDIPMTELDWIAMDHRIFTVSAVLSCISFSILFLFLLKDRIAYIRKITDGIDALHDPSVGISIQLEGNNELTALARAINEMSKVRQQLYQREQALAAEKEQLVRSLSHDIRTPLTSILAYTEFLNNHEKISPRDQRNYLQLIEKKAAQIRDLTSVLLEGGRRNPEYFADARLLMEQLAAELEESLEDRFRIELDFSGCTAFSGSFDVPELRRIFDNLSSNVQKYADPGQPVKLYFTIQKSTLLICQTNGIINPRPRSESFQIGLNSIRRIVQHYGGQVTVAQETDFFSIVIALPL